MQNLAPARFSVPQLEQITPGPSPVAIAAGVEDSGGAEGYGLTVTLKPSKTVAEPSASQRLNMPAYPSA
jgi:hypothetical protein